MFKSIRPCLQKAGDKENQKKMFQKLLFVRVPYLQRFFIHGNFYATYVTE